MTRKETDKRVLKDERGAVAVSYALALTGLIAIMGVGFDYARVMGMDSELQNGADQAALAGASQLDGETGACSRASAAIVNLLTNRSVLTSDSNTVTIPSETACDATGQIRFWQDEDKNTAATADSNANFVEVFVDVRTVDYAFLPITGYITSSDMSGVAMAGLESAICKVPPLMICSPDPTVSVINTLTRGDGVRVTGQGGNSWAPGDFGFLEVGQTQLEDLVRALAYDSSGLDCAPIDGGTDPETGNAQQLFDAINTRFDIEPVTTGAGTTLGPCTTGSCPPAANVIKDLVKPSNATNGNTCRIHNQGWQLPPVSERFSPHSRADLFAAGKNPDVRNAETVSENVVTAMGLTRDLCHYNSFAQACSAVNGGYSDKFGNGRWAIGDYFQHIHGVAPVDVNWTRYETYLWEIAQDNMPQNIGTPLRQFGRPLCLPGTSPSIDRRILTVAIVKNCDALRGGSTSVEVDEWVDMFMVEPIVDDTDEINNGRVRDGVYLEYIGEASVGGGSGSSEPLSIRKDIPYLVQ